MLTALRQTLQPLAYGARAGHDDLPPVARSDIERHVCPGTQAPVLATIAIAASDGAVRAIMLTISPAEIG